MAEQNATTMAAEIDEEGSPVTESESDRKLAECDDTHTVLSRPKRKRQHPKKLHDYEQNARNKSPVSEESSFRDHEISLDDLLDTLHSPLTTQVRSSQPLPNVSHWSEPYNDSCIQKYFKMTRRVVGTDEFIVRYLYDGNEQLREKEKLKFAREIDALQDWLEQSTSCIDTTEHELFLPSRCAPGKQRGYRQQFHEDAMQHRDDLLYSTLTTGMDGVKFAKKYRGMSGALKGAVSLWVQTVANAVILSPNDVDESVFENVFRRYLEVFPLICIDGKSAKLGIPYRNTEVPSVPDLIFRRDLSSRFFGVVKVKKMTLDPTLKHAYEEPPKHGILSISDDGLKPPKKKCVNFPVASATSTTEESGEDENRDASDLGGSPPTDSQRLFVKLFFGQLFGHVLGLDCCPASWCYPQGASAFPKRLGIGVVGFREVPCVGSHRMHVLMTSELSLLKASDRKEINKILLALSRFLACNENGLSDDDATTRTSEESETVSAVIGLVKTSKALAKKGPDRVDCIIKEFFSFQGKFLKIVNMLRKPVMR